MRKLARRIWTFTKKVFCAAKDKVVDFVEGCYHHAEAITILTLSALGLNALLGELPFLIALPMWVEAALVIPVISVLLIAGLTRSAEWRTNRRARKALAAA